MESLSVFIEALVFASESPISLDELAACLESHLHIPMNKKLLVGELQALQAKYDADEYAMELLEIAGGYQFFTKKEYGELVGTLLKQRSNKRLSRAALETLAVIVYQQPIAKSELERLRGVNCDYAVHKLLEKELIEIKGRSAEPGRPLLYGTTAKFMQHFGLASLKDLPKLKEFAPEENQIGERTD